MEYIVSIPASIKALSTERKFGVVHQIKGLVVDGSWPDKLKDETGPSRILFMAVASQVKSAGAFVSKFLTRSIAMEAGVPSVMN